MASPSYAIVFSAQASGTNATGYAGDVLIPDATSGLYTAATAAARGSRRSTGVALHAYTANGTVEIQQCGQLDALLTGLGAGSATWIRVSDAGILERADTVGASDDIVGTCETDGTAHLMFGIISPAMAKSAGETFTNPTIVFSNTALKPDSTFNNHAVFQDIRTDNATRVYIEPSGHPSGTKAKLDFMFDPYESDDVNYRIMGFDTLDDQGTTGVNGVALVNVKSVGDAFGVWPALHIGYQDGSSTGVPLKLYNFDASDSAWRTPMKGAWRTGVLYTNGDYALANNKLYQASSTGTSGSTKPSHVTGTVSDGGVNWLFVRDYAAASSHIHPMVMIGERDDMPKFGFETYRLQMSAPALMWNTFHFSFLNSTNTVEAWGLYCKTGGSDDLYIADATESKFVRFGGTSKLFQSSGFARGMGSKTEATLSATPDVSGCDILTFNNASGTVVTSFSGGVANQRLFVRSSNGQTTLQNGANLVLSGGADKTLSSSQVLEFVFGSSGTVATEVGGPAPGKSSGSAVSISTGTTTLSVAQASYPYIKLTGSLSGNVTVVLPAADGREWVVDATGCTLNAHTITLQANSNAWSTTIGVTSLYQVFYNATLGKLVGSTLAT